MNKKGVVDIIAIILLLLITVALVGSTFVWFESFQGELQTGVEEKSEDVLSSLNIDVRIFNTEYESGDLIVWLKNDGTIDISFGEETLVNVKDLEGNEVCTNKGEVFSVNSVDLKAGESSKFVLEDVVEECTLNSGDYVVTLGFNGGAVSSTFEV